MRKQSLAQIIGFCYLIIEPRSTQYAKCWMDGDDEDVRIFSKQDLMDMADMDGDNPKIKAMLNKVFSESAIFLWEVEEERISQLYASRIEDEPEPRKFHPIGSTAGQDIGSPVTMTPSGRVTVDRDLSFLGVHPVPIDTFKY